MPPNSPTHAQQITHSVSQTSPNSWSTIRNTASQLSRQAKQLEHTLSSLAQQLHSNSQGLKELVPYAGRLTQALRSTPLILQLSTQQHDAHRLLSALQHLQRHQTDQLNELLVFSGLERACQAHQSGRLPPALHQAVQLAIRPQGPLLTEAQPLVHALQATQQQLQATIDQGQQLLPVLTDAQTRAQAALQSAIDTHLKTSQVQVDEYTGILASLAQRVANMPTSSVEAHRAAIERAVHNLQECVGLLYLGIQSTAQELHTLQGQAQNPGEHAELLNALLAEKKSLNGAGRHLESIESAQQLLLAHASQLLVLEQVHGRLQSVASQLSAALTQAEPGKGHNPHRAFATHTQLMACRTTVKALDAQIQFTLGKLKQLQFELGNMPVFRAVDFQSSTALIERAHVHVELGQHLLDVSTTIVSPSNLMRQRTRSLPNIAECTQSTALRGSSSAPSLARPHPFPHPSI